MLLKEEFAANMSYLEPSINSMILAGDDLVINKPLQEVLYMVLVAGNFLNSVTFRSFEPDPSVSGSKDQPRARDFREATPATRRG